MPSGDVPPRRGRLRRGLRRVALAVVGLAVLLGALSLTGLPQRMVAGFLLSSQLDGRATVESIHLENPLVAQGLSLAGSTSSIYGPLVQVGRVEAAYQLRPDNGRHIETVTISDVQISLEQGESENNFQFLLDRLTQPSSGGDMTPWLPERIDLEGLGLALRFPGYQLQADQLNLHAELESATRGGARLDAPAAALAWSSAAGTPGEQHSSGSIAVDAAWNPGGADVDVAVDLGALARLNGTFTTAVQAGAPSYQVSVSEATLADPFWSAVINGLSPVPTRFDSLQLKDSNVQFHFRAQGPAIDRADVDLALTGFAVGPPASPYYSGPLHLSLHGNYGDQSEIGGTLTLRERLALNASFQLSPDGVTGTFDWEPWPREELMALVPPAYGGVLATLEPLTGLGAKGTLSQSADAFTVDGTLAAVFGEAAPMPIPLAISWTRAAGAATLAISLEAAMEEARLKSTTTVPQGQPARVENVLTSVSPNAWTARMLGKELLPGLTASLSGRADLSLPAGQPLGIDLDLSGVGLGYGSLALPAEVPLAIVGKMDYDGVSGTIGGKSLKLSQEGTAEVRVTGWSFDLPRAALNAALEGTLSLDAIGQIFALSDLHGSTALQGQLAVTAGGTRFGQVTATSEDLGYGDWSVPYGSQLSLTGSLSYDPAAGALRLEPIQAAIGDGTQCSLAALAFQFADESRPLAVNFDGLRFTSDLNLLAGRGLITSATGGHASLTSEKLAWDGSAFTGLASWEFRAETLELPEKMGSFTNLVHTGKYAPDTGETGGGPLSVGPFTVYEIPFGAATAELSVTPDLVSCTPFETTFLGGTLVLDAALKYHEAQYPATIKAEARALDLEQFTQTFKPPDVVMTGKVNGTAALVISSEGLVDLNVDLTASENLTLNQAAVRQILMSQYVNDAVGSKSIQKVIESVIGKDDQRAFEKAAITLHLEEGLIVGEARLESKNLDVTVDIKAEPEAILQAIQSAAEETP